LHFYYQQLPVRLTRLHLLSRNTTFFYYLDNSSQLHFLVFIFLQIFAKRKGRSLSTTPSLRLLGSTSRWQRPS
jgi:hypothetical protein